HRLIEPDSRSPKRECCLGQRSPTHHLASSRGGVFQRRCRFIDQCCGAEIRNRVGISLNRPAREAPAHVIDIRITQPGSFDRRGRWNPPRSKSRRERWLHPPDIDNGDDVCLPRESRVEKMYEAVRKDDRTPDVASADKHERPPPWS